MFPRLLTIAVLAGAALAADRNPAPSSLTLVIEYETPPSPASIAEMRQELKFLLSETPVRVDWRLRSEISSGLEIADLAVIRFRGNCRMETMPVVFDERGPLAFTHTSDGEILPFSEVLCDRVRVLARSAMFGGDFARQDQLLGRALARVIAHELYHMVGQNHGHGKEGVARHSLTGSQLIADRFALQPRDAARMGRKPSPAGLTHP